MTSRTVQKGKNKKPLETTLGKAVKPHEKKIDLSHVRKPIDTSIFGLCQVLELCSTATEEVKQYIRYECDIMYECRMCRTIYRSLANFILHKRNYCKESYDPRDHTNCRNHCVDNGYYVIQEAEIENHDTAVTQPTEHVSTQNQAKKRKLTTVLEMLNEKQKDVKVGLDALNEDISNDSELCNSNMENMKQKNNVILEPIGNNAIGVFQTVTENTEEHKKNDLMKTQVMEIQNILNSNEAILGVDGKILESKTNEKLKQNLRCEICKLKFSTKKTYTYHIKYKHNNSRIVFPCPVCQDTFANAWCVFRHLHKIHRKTNAQIKKMRAQIHASGIRKDEEPEKKTKDFAVIKDDENQWMDNIEGDNDFQMCGGCGKRFERKAALNSHSQTCTKRIAICNTIKENAKKMQIEEVENKKYAPKTKETGSKKRKPTATKQIKQNFFIQTFAEDVVVIQDDDDDNYVEQLNEQVKTINDNNEIPILEKEIPVLEKEIPILENEITKIVSTSEDTLSHEYVEEIQVENIDEETTVNEESNDEVIFINSTQLSEPNFPSREEETETNDQNYVINLDDDMPNLNDTQQLFEHQSYLSLNTELKSVINEIRTDCNKSLIEKNDDYSNPSERQQLLQTNEEPSINSVSLGQRAIEIMDLENLKCLYCNIKFISKHNLYTHISQHINWFYYKCSKCLCMFNDKKLCIEHITKQHQITDFINNHVLLVSNCTLSKKGVEENLTGNKELSEENDIPYTSTDIEDCLKNKSNLDVQKMVRQVIFGDTPATSSPTDEVSETENVNLPTTTTETVPSVADNNRPIRNRIKSFKTVQQDFLYDMSQINKIMKEPVTSELNVKKTLKKNCLTNKINLNTKSLKVYVKKKVPSNKNTD